MAGSKPPVGAKGERKKSRGSGRLNRSCCRSIPAWQKPITMFFLPKCGGNSQKSDGKGGADGASTSTSNNSKEPSDNSTTENSKQNEKPDSQMTPITISDDSMEFLSCSGISKIDEKLELALLSEENNINVDEYFSENKSVMKTKEIINVNNDIAKEKKVVMNKDEEVDDLSFFPMFEDDELEEIYGIMDGRDNAVDSSMDKHKGESSKNDIETVEMKKREREEINDEEAVNAVNIKID